MKITKRKERFKGGTIIEGTSGNTGWACVNGCDRYKATFVMPDKQSEEKRQALRAWGAKVVITPTDVAADDQILLQGFRAIGTRNGKQLLCQSVSQSQPQGALFKHKQLWDQLDGNIDVFIAGVGRWYDCRNGAI